ncbi:MAG: hypothetical protein LH614_19095 [Pyrinomonadaceae bacterium]|nr:hypothetical protein [Pyrinomonadaceae bacterium]
MANREVFVKITALDNSSKAINLISEALARLQKELNNSGADKTASYKTASYDTAV